MAPSARMSSNDALRASRLIIAALAAGIVGFAALAFYVRARETFTGPATEPAGGFSPLGLLWAITLLGAGAAALFLWRGAANLVSGPGAAERLREEALGAEFLFRRLVICAALFEAPALLGLVVFLLEGSTVVFATSLFVSLTGLAFLFPSREMFRPFD